MSDRQTFTNPNPTYEVELDHGVWRVTRRSFYAKQGWGVGAYATEGAAVAAGRFLAALAHLESDAVNNRENEQLRAADQADRASAAWAEQAGAA